MLARSLEYAPFLPRIHADAMTHNDKARDQDQVSYPAIKSVSTPRSAHNRSFERTYQIHTASCHPANHMCGRVETTLSLLQVTGRGIGTNVKSISLTLLTPAAYSANEWEGRR